MHHIATVKDRTTVPHHHQGRIVVVANTLSKLVQHACGSRDQSSVRREIHAMSTTRRQFARQRRCMLDHRQSAMPASLTYLPPRRDRTCHRSCQGCHGDWISTHPIVGIPQYPHTHIEPLALEEYVHGQRGRGRPKKRWLDS